MEKAVGLLDLVLCRPGPPTSGEGKATLTLSEKPILAGIETV